MTAPVLESTAAAPPASPASAWGYRPALDGLRTVAVFLVLAFHADIDIVAGGFVGVDLFFVLSGFVVTNVLWSELRATGSVRLRSFYARRMRRLTPAAILCVVGTSFAFLLVAALPVRLDFVADARAGLLYFANWHFLAESTDYFAAAESPSPFLHFWSLSIEEQFYAFFPLVLIGLVRIGARTNRTVVVPIGLAAFIALSLASQLWWSGRNTAWAYYGTDARLYQMLAGCLAAVMLREHVRLKQRRAYGVAAAVGIVGLLLVSTSWFDVTASRRGIVAAVLSLMIVVGLEQSREGAPARFLATRPMVYLGGISYGIYLWHWPVLLVLKRLLMLQPTTFFVVGAVLSTGLAAASSELFEKPVRSAKMLDKVPMVTVAVGLAATVFTSLVLVPPVLESRRTPRIAVEERVVSDIAVPVEALPASFGEPVPRDIDYEGIRSNRIDIPECSVDEPASCTVRRGNGPHVLVIGDSIAQMFLPALRTIADAQDWTLSVNVWPGCTWQNGVGPRPDLARDQTDECTRRRAEWYPEAVSSLDPDVIVLSSLNRDDASRWDGLVVGIDGVEGVAETAPPSEVLAAATVSTLDELSESDAEVLIFEPTPIAPDLAGPTVCLGAAVTIGQCSFEKKAPTPTEELFRSEAARRPDVETLDLDPLICPDAPICMPIVGGEVTWRDDAHLNHEFVESITPELEGLLLGTGLFEER